MAPTKKILVICGSTRKTSSNLHLIKAIEKLYGNQLIFTLYEGLLQLSQFNPDDDTETPPLPVAAMRKQVKDADGILICTPEYAMGVPGSLKNLLDWTVSSSDFSHKPVAAITASLSGQKGHLSLLSTLRVIEARVEDDMQLLIPFIKTKVNDRQEITDEATLKEVKKTMDALVAALSSSKIVEG